MLLPEDALHPSFRNLNIINTDHFRATVKQALAKCGKRGGKVAVSLPCETVKVLIRQFADLPDSDKEREEMVLWNLSRTLNLPIEDIRISWEIMGKNSSGQYVLLILVAWDAVLFQYEEEIRKAGLIPLLLSPVSILLFNFYAEAVPASGRIAFLSIFDHYITLFAFEDGVPFFFKNIKKGYSGTESAQAKGKKENHSHLKENHSNIDDVDMLIQYCRSECPDLDMEKIIVVPSDLSYYYDKEMFLDLGRNIECIFPDDTEFMEAAASAYIGIEEIGIEEKSIISGISGQNSEQKSDLSAHHSQTRKKHSQTCKTGENSPLDLSVFTAAAGAAATTLAF